MSVYTSCACYHVWTTKAFANHFFFNMVGNDNVQVNSRALDKEYLMTETCDTTHLLVSDFMRKKIC